MDNIIEKNKALEAELERLKAKCNKQLEFIKELQASGSATKNVEKNYGLFAEYFETFYRVIAEVIRNDNFFPKKKLTEKAKQYNVLDFKILTDYIDKHKTIESPTLSIPETWADLGLLAREDNGKIIINYTWGGKTVRSVRVSKNAVEFVKECMIHD